MTAQLVASTRCSHGSVSRVRKNAAFPETIDHRFAYGTDLSCGEPVVTAANEIFVI
jgi:hypothetical protein